MFAQVSSDGESAGPCECPEGQGSVRVACLELDGMPERQDFVGQVESDVLEPGNIPEPGVTKDEGPRETSLSLRGRVP